MGKAQLTAVRGAFRSTMKSRESKKKYVENRAQLWYNGYWATRLFPSSFPNATSSPLQPSALSGLFVCQLDADL